MLNKLVLVISVFATVVYFVSSYKVTIEKTANGFIIQPKDTDKTNTLSPRIIGGEEVTPHKYPFQTGLLIYKGNDTYFCGGTLITNQWVLTAATCVAIKPEVITVILGAHDLQYLDDNAIQLFNATKYKHHSDWDAKTYQNDVGLVRLPKNATLNQYVNVVELAKGTGKYVGEQAIILGWGKTETEERSTVLKRVFTTIITNEDCANTNVDNKGIIKPMHVCTAGEGPKATCDGDTGGPLLVDGIQAGIVSFLTTDCSLGLPSVFTRVADFQDWLKDHQTDDGFDNGGDGEAGAHSDWLVTVEETANGYIIQPKDTKNANSPSLRIMGGDEVIAYQYPFQAVLFIHKGDKVYLCGGTLITNQWVLTAASCLEMKPKFILVLLGSHSLTDSLQSFKTTQYKYHKDWNNATFQNDIGLIRLPSNATLNKHVNIVELATGTDRYVGKEATTLGWGKTENEIVSDVLKQVTTTIISNEDCAKASESYKELIKPNHICTFGKRAKSSCYGDTGGPLLVDNVQIGVGSALFPSEGCSSGLPSAFTRETDFNNWINDNLVDEGFDDNGDDDDDNDDGGASTHSLHFVAIVSIALLCFVRSFDLM